MLKIASILEVVDALHNKFVNLNIYFNNSYMFISSHEFLKAHAIKLRRYYVIVEYDYKKCIMIYLSEWLIILFLLLEI